MAFRLALNFENEKHRFLKNAKILLTLNGAAQPETKDSKLGKHLWDLPGAADGQTYELTIRIPAPPNSGGVELFALKQPMELKSDAATGFRLNPKDGDGHWKNFFNPRLTGHWVAAAGGKRFEITADLTFLDVTTYFQRFTHDPANASKKNPGLDRYNAMTPVDPANPNHYKTRLRLLEFTGGQPVTWAVVIPEKVDNSGNEIHAFMFFRPTMGFVYSNTDDVIIEDMLRYLGDQPPAQTPFYAQDLDVGGFAWVPYPRCSWERQIQQAGKRFLFVHPFPHGSGFGLASSAIFPTLLSSLCKSCLWADQTIATSFLAGVHLGKIALGGFSIGGQALYSALTANPDKIDELYLFDPLDTAKNQARITGWFAKGGKRLRMLGGHIEYPTMLTLAAALKSATATVNPTSRGAWPSSMYALAVKPVKAGKRRTLLTVGDPETDADKRELSDKSQIFFIATGADGSVEIEAVLTSGKRTRRTIADCTREEVAGFIAAGLNIALKGKVLLQRKPLPNGKFVPAGMIEFPGADGKPLFANPKFVLIIPSKTEKDVDHNVTVFQHYIKEARHQWAVAGGDDPAMDPKRGTGFIGFLQQCLRDSSFT